MSHKVVDVTRVREDPLPDAIISVGALLIFSFCSLYGDSERAKQFLLVNPLLAVLTLPHIVKIKEDLLTRSLIFEWAPRTISSIYFKIVDLRFIWLGTCTCHEWRLRIEKGMSLISPLWLQSELLSDDPFWCCCQMFLFWEDCGVKAFACVSII